MRSALRRLQRRLARPKPYQPATYWENRSRDLIDTYDDPASWLARGWPISRVEESAVPRLLDVVGARSAFVVGAGSGRQYAFLEPLGIALRGIDISATLAAECRRRYPSIETTCDTLVGMEDRHTPANAVLSTAVLQHVAPADLPRALSSVKAMAKRIVVIRELTWLANPADYIWAHDYIPAFADWTLVHDEQTDSTDHYEIRLRAWTRDGGVGASSNSR